MTQDPSSVTPNAVSTDSASATRAASGVSATTMAAPSAASSIKTVWYLGGNHIVKLLTSVDGDLDPNVLSKLEAVPSVVGELALSVESLVSDDITVGGFESDLLAKIASNTLSAKRGSLSSRTSETQLASTAVSATTQPANPPPQPELPSETGTPATPSAGGSVPNPLQEVYEPVPNPLVRITPPGSPNPASPGKRKAGSAVEDASDEVGKPNKVMRRTEMIEAR
eukprot:CAMPEP_0178822204 /NCGR_PEP_ID=MMETSP0746-20121128/4471_1 /TAXON_ID=913974 /ORGANISM="Nitzschia punctata, Strain CCMP561" /LENGTH=224 /DNA_ID=CAMNT_0020483701 /DNA_START=153 /DNA_END=827 /DNA_ORIENTATION=+